MNEIVFPETYHYRLACGNCNRTVGLDITQGITVDEYIKTHVCGNCGCMLDSNAHQYTHTQGLYLPIGGFR